MESGLALAVFAVITMSLIRFEFGACVLLEKQLMNLILEAGKEM